MGSERTWRPENPSPFDPAWREVGRWILSREKPFTLDEALGVFRGRDERAAVRERLAQYLKTHPSLAEAGGRFYNPRSLAGCCRFLIRLLPVEREDGFLIPGHRFLPFMPFSIDPEKIILEMPGGDRTSRKSVTVPAEAVATATALFQARHPGTPFPARSGPHSRDEVRVIRLSGLGSAMPQELVVSCLDFDHLIYHVAPWEEKDPAARREGEAMLRAAMKEILTRPPEGPIDAARQLLQAVSACMPGVAGRPFGPLGPLFTQGEGIRLVGGQGRPRFVLADRNGHEDVIPASGGTLEDFPAFLVADILEDVWEGLPHHIRERGSDYLGRVRDLRWHAKEGILEASVRGSAPQPYRVGIRVDPDEDKVGLGCTCPYAEDPETPCKHVAAVLEKILLEIDQDGTDVGPFPSSFLARRPFSLPLPPPPPPVPAWKRALEGVDRLIGASPTGPADTRLVWRLGCLERDGISLAPCRQKRMKNGNWSQGQHQSGYRLIGDRDAWISAVDRAAAEAISGDGGYGGYGSRGSAGLFRALECLAGHPLVFWEGDNRAPVAVSLGQAQLRIERLPSGEIELLPEAGGLTGGRGSDCHLFAQGLILIPKGRERVVVARLSPLAGSLLRELLGNRVSLPTEAAEELLARIPSMESVLPLVLPPEWAGEEVPADLRHHLLLTPEGESGLVAALRMRPLGMDAGALPPGEGPTELRSLLGTRRRFARRDLESEAARARDLAGELGLAAFPEEPAWTWRIPDEAALDLLASLQALKREDLLVSWPEGVRPRVVREAGPEVLRLQIEARKDWLGLEGRIELEGRSVPLAGILEALRRGRRYVPLGEGDWCRLSDLLRERLISLAHASRGAGKLELGQAAVPLVAEIAREAGQVEAAPSWTATLKCFEEAMRISPEPPQGFRGELRPYQMEGYRWLSRLAAWRVGGCLADDMGLGKTVQALAVLMDRAEGGPALVVSPTSVGSNWVREAGRFAPSLRPVLYRESARDPKGAYGKGDLVVASYGLVLRDIEKLSQVGWHTLLLDEAQFLKNSQTKTSQAVRRLEADWRLALTGTPLENHLSDLWSLFRAVSPGLFGSWERFREDFALPIEARKDAGRRKLLSRMVSPFVLRRTKAEVLKDLPPRIEVQLEAELSAEERRLYDAARLAAVERLSRPAEEGEDRRFQVLAALTELRQIACHPRLVYPDLETPSSKLEVFLETVEELREEGHRALVFSQFTRYLALVREALEARGVPYRYLDGSTPPGKRDEAVKEFQEGQADLFLISLKAGGTGLNLTAADHVIHLDPWWNPAVEDQATGRAHRIGQTRPVIVSRIVATGTIEEQILSLHADKRDLVAGILEGTDRAGKLSTEDLISLIREGGAATSAEWKRRCAP